MAAKTKKRKFSWTRDDTELTLLCLPTTVWYALFCFLPMFGIIIAFKHYTVTARTQGLTTLPSSSRTAACGML